MKPKISIIIPTYNRAHYIEETIESALSQDYGNYEVIVSDNASTDNTVEIIKKYLSNKKFRYYRNETNIGMVKNWRKALYEYSEGEWFLVLSDDDYFIDNTYISQAMSLIQKYKNVNIVYANGYIKDETSGKFVSLDLPFDEINDGRKIFLTTRSIKPQDFTLCNILFNKKESLKFNPFCNEFNLGCDSELFLFLCLTGKVAIVNSYVSVYRVHSSNLIKQTNTSWEIFFNEHDFLVNPYQYAISNKLLTVAQAELFRMKILLPYFNNRLILSKLLFHDKEREYTRFIDSIDVQLLKKLKQNRKFRIKYFLASFPKFYSIFRYLIKFCITFTKKIFYLKGIINKALYIYEENGFSVLIRLIIGKILFIKNTFAPKKYISNLDDSFDANTNKETILLLTHDCSRTGAPFVILNIAKTLKRTFNKKVIFISLNGGELEGEFKSLGSFINLNQHGQKNIINNQNIDEIFLFFKRNNIEIALSNSVVTGMFAYFLNKYDFKFLNLIHELPDTIIKKNFLESAYSINKYSRKVVFPSVNVRDRYELFFTAKRFKPYIHAQGVNITNKFYDKKDDVNKLFYLKYGVPENDKIILGSGNSFMRKGIDIFFDVADIILTKHSDIHFIWFGAKEYPFSQELEKKISTKSYRKNIKFILPQKDPALVFSRADIFLLTSREDPFPTVVLDEMDAGVPVIAFKKSGGIFEVLQDNCGVVIENSFDSAKMADSLLELLNDQKKYQTIRGNAKKIIAQKYNYQTYTKFLLDTVQGNHKC